MRVPDSEFFSNPRFPVGVPLNGCRLSAGVGFDGDRRCASCDVECSTVFEFGWRQVVLVLFAVDVFDLFDVDCVDGCTVCDVGVDGGRDCQCDRAG